MALLGWLGGRRKAEQSAIQMQHEVCARFGAKCSPVMPGSKAGVALHTRGAQPLNALRHPPEPGMSGWYLWWGDTFDENNDAFFQPLHVEHLPEDCPAVVPYLSLPAGWRVQVAPGHEDVWFDEELLHPKV